MKIGVNNVFSPSEISSNFVDIHSKNVSEPMFGIDGRLVEGEDAMSEIMWNEFGGIRNEKYDDVLSEEIELSNFNKVDSINFGRGTGAGYFGNFSGKIGTPHVFSPNKFSSGRISDYGLANRLRSEKFFGSADGDEKASETTTTTTTTTTSSKEATNNSVEKQSETQNESSRVFGMQKKTAMFVGGALLIGLGVLGYLKFVKK